MQTFLSDIEMTRCVYLFGLKFFVYLFYTMCTYIILHT